MALEDRIDDGHATLVSFGDFPSVEFYERTVKLPGMDGGPLIDTTGMRNTVYRTFSERALKTLTQMTLVCAYTSEFFADANMNAMVNVNQLVTVELPDGATWEFYAVVNSVDFSPNTEGEQPLATITVTPTNTHPTTKVETAPVHTPAP